MTSKLIVNSLAADTGVSTITFADQAKMGNSIFHSTGFTIGDSFLHSTGVNLTNINATGVITATKFVGEVSVGSSITFEDNEKAYFGTGTDFSIYHNGSASYLDETGTGGLIAKTNTAFQVFNSAGSQAALTVTPGGAVELYHNTTKVLETKGYGIDITGGFIQTGNSIINDNGKLQFGTQGDYQIYHDGSNAVHRVVGDGDLKLLVEEKNFIVQGTGGHQIIKGIDNGAVELYHNNVLNLKTNTNAVYVSTSADQGRLRFADTSGNIAYQITGTDVASSGESGGRMVVQDALGGMVLDFRTAGSNIFCYNTIKLNGNASADNLKLIMGASEDLQLYHNGSHSYIINNTGALIIQAANSNEIQLNGNGQHAAKFNPTGTSYIYYNGSVRFSIGASNTVHSEDFVPGADNTYDLGHSSYRWRNIYTADLHCSNRGSSNDVDGTWGDYTIQEGESDLFLINNRSGKKYKFNLTEVS